jgi:hypothetical protein
MPRTVRTAGYTLKQHLKKNLLASELPGVRNLITIQVPIKNSTADYSRGRHRPGRQYAEVTLTVNQARCERLGGPGDCGGEVKATARRRRCQLDGDSGGRAFHGILRLDIAMKQNHLIVMNLQCHETMAARRRRAGFMQPGPAPA